MSATITTLTCYPVKGLGGQTLDSVTLETVRGFPNDRRFGFARPNSGFDPHNPNPLPKGRFYMLARDAAMALLQTRYSDDSGLLSLSSSNSQGQFDIHTDAGKRQASAFLQSWLQLPAEEVPQLYEASPHRFTDVSVDSAEMMNAVSIINRNSVDAFAEAIGQPVNPRRFRGNILISGMPPFAELDMMNREITLGTVRLKIVQRTRRCPATEVNLETGERDMKTPRLLHEHYGHMDMGVYALVMHGGTLSVGDTINIASSEA